MTKPIEIRSYRLKPGARPELERFFHEEALPLLLARGIDVVAFGPSPDVPDAALLVYTDTVITVDEATIDGLRRVGSGVPA